MNAIRRWPSSNRCPAASSPPRAWSTETEQNCAVAASPVEQDDEGAPVSQRLEMADAARGGSDHDALHALLLEQPEVPGLPFGRAVGGAHDDGATLLVHGVLEAADRLGRRTGSRRRARRRRSSGCCRLASDARPSCARIRAGRSPRGLARASPARRVSGRLRTFDAVPSDTPACSATSRIVTRLDGCRRRTPSVRAVLADERGAALRRDVNGLLALGLPWVTRDAGLVGEPSNVG